LGARDPGGEEASVVGCFVVDGFRLMISEHIDLCIRGQFVEWFVVVLVAFDVEDVEFDGEGLDGGSDGLKNVVVRGEEVEGGCLVINSPVEIFDHGIIVNWDQECGVGFIVLVDIGVLLEKGLDPGESSKKGMGQGTVLWGEGSHRR